MQSFITQAPEAMALVKLAYPQNTNNSVTICTCSGDDEHNCGSYWSEGYRDYFTFIDLSTMQLAQAPQQSAFDRQVVGLDRVKLPKGIVIVVQHFMGTRKSVSIHIRNDDLNPKFLPLPKPELSEAEKKVLYYTRSLKNSYGGRTNIRQQESGMGMEEWKSAQTNLILKGLLNKQCSLTIDGKNIARGINFNR
jgi:hypothetical protein